MKSFLLNTLWLIQSFFLAIGTIVLLFLPSLVYVFCGGTDATITYNLRFVGFFIFVVVLIWCTRK